MRLHSFSRFAFAISACLLGIEVSAATSVKDIRLSATADATRVVLDLSDAVTAKVAYWPNPDRVVLDIPDGQLQLSDARLPEGRGRVKALRTGIRENGDLRVVLEVAGPVEARSINVDPNEQQGHRLLVVLSEPGKGVARSMPVEAEPIAAKPAAVKQINVPSAAASLPLAPSTIKSASAGKARDLVIAIDAGHGGKDPGAIGRRGTQEKDVALAIARKLKAKVDAEPGMRAILTRDGDYYVPHRERTDRAFKQKADMFISIHADSSAHDRSAKGSSIYVLSAGRATNEAAHADRLLADRENAELIGGVSLGDKEDGLAALLLDLSQGVSMTASVEAADQVLRQLGRVTDVLHDEVRGASLVVLTSPDIPSMLIETAFISNSAEEAKLRDVRHQQKLADAILAGMRTYFYDNPPPGTRVAEIKAQQRKLASRDNAAIGAPVMAAGGLSP